METSHATQVSEHGSRFWYGSEYVEQNGLDIRDVQLHAICFMGLNLGLRFDELAKLKIDHVSVDEGCLTMTITESIKNSTVQRDYRVRRWPGKSALRNSVLMDPFLAILTWLSIRGRKPGFTFCDIIQSRGGGIINPSKVLPARKLSCSFVRD